MKATFEWCPRGVSCPDRMPWPDAHRTLGVMVAMEEPFGVTERDHRRAVERYLADCLLAAPYVTDQRGARRHTPPTAHFVIHEMDRSDGSARGWAAHYAGHVPPDDLIEAQPLYGSLDPTLPPRED